MLFVPPLIPHEDINHHKMSFFFKQKKLMKQLGNGIFNVKVSWGIFSVAD